MKNRWIYISVVLACVVSFAQAFETDHEYNRRELANGAFYEADQNKDNKLDASDGKALAKYADLDANGNGSVERNEFMDNAQPEYPAWAGNVERNIVYKRAGDAVLLLDIYPPLVKKYEKAPVFYYTHGGGWSGGQKEIGYAERPVFEALSKEGFVCVGVSYRLVKMWKADEKVFMYDCLVDCRDGLRFLKKHEKELGLDMDRVVVFGSSAGGHIAQLLTFSDPDAFAGQDDLMQYKVSLAAGISWYGPSDFRDKNLFITEGLEDKFAPDFWARRITKQESFSYPDESEDVKKTTDKLSPVWWLKKQSAPLLHIHGDQDVVISPNHAHHLKAKAEAVGAPVDVVMVKGAGHGWWAKDIEPDKKTLEEMTVKFALQHVKQGD